ncbi:MAG: DUF1801 domain-containing protein [Patescibacteria group bacterium]
MPKNENQTKPTKISASTYIASLPLERRADVGTVAKMMEKATGKKPVMWGPSIIGFDEYHYKYDSGREGDAPLIGFSPRKQNLTLYVLSSSRDSSVSLKKLGKHKVSGSCLHINKLSDIDTDVLQQLIAESVKDSRKRHKAT